MATQTSPLAPARGQVLLGGGHDRPRSQHEIACHSAVARQLADLLGLDFAGRFRDDTALDRPSYFVPQDVLVGLDDAAACGILGERDLFGGVVPHAVTATKSISHPCVGERAFAPPGWSWSFAHAVQPVTLPGYVAFDAADVLTAAQRLLQEGPVRLKLAHANAGRGQFVAAGMAAVEEVLRDIDPAEMHDYGLVIEADLVDPVTYSVGEVRVGNQVIAYHGRQWLTRDNDGQPVYGGSELEVHRGDLAQLLEAPLPEPVHAAVRHAHRYDQAARTHLHGMFASRRNYDVARGRDHRGIERMGVLESSWRIGGASSAEVAALGMLRERPALRSLLARSVELYGEDPPVPPGAQILFQGDDPDTGPITVCTLVEAHGDT